MTVARLDGVRLLVLPTRESRTWILVWSIGGVILREGKSKFVVEICPNAILFTTYLT